jgi:hypothetical protein
MSSFFEIDPKLLPPLKLGLHCGQVLLSFVAWCLEIAVFRAENAKITGENGWTFAVVSLPRANGCGLAPRMAVLQDTQLTASPVLPFSPGLGLSHHDAAL